MSNVGFSMDRNRLMISGGLGAIRFLGVEGKMT